MAISIKKMLQIVTYIIVFETILGGAGRVFAIGALSLRMGLYGVAFVLMALYILSDKSRINELKLDSIFTRLVIIFCAYVLFAALNGYFFAYHNLNKVVGDVTGYISLLLVFLFNITIQDKFEIRKVSIFIVIATFIQAVALLMIHYLLAFGILNSSGLNVILQNYYIGNLSFIVPNTIRVFFKSSLYLQVGFTLLLIIISKEKNRKWLIIEYISLILITYATILSFTRGFWIGLVISFIIILMCKQVKFFMRTIVILMIGLTIMMGFSFAAYKNTNVLTSVILRTGIVKSIAMTKTANNTNTQQTEKDDTDVQDLSVSYRSKLTSYIEEYIKKSPVIGNGFGTTITELKQQNSRNEYMYLDIWMEMGIIGLLLFASIFILLLKKWIEIRKRTVSKSDISYLDAIMASLVGVVVTSGINPFLNNPIGITFLLFAISAINVYRKDI